ncbi:MAG: tRNA (adenosine(37)-N6)-dimethylallyltransferase MiaA [Bacilli bacterium]|nr:tRNA (adenosine(37)-N6)-dimethylallyltransferase MiaA [Bacilli bacterium]
MEKVLVIIGPTAVGKTALSIKMAKKFNGEIINGDSVQVYRSLDIGSAKIKPEEMEGIPHHLLDILEPTESFSVADFQKLVRQKIKEITNRGNLPIIVGGTGLYIQAALYDFRFEDPGRNDEYTSIYNEISNEELHQLLMNIDPDEASKTHPNNRRRILRALEIHAHLNKTKTELLALQKHELLYDVFIIGLDMERKQLYDRINKRVDQMMQDNLPEEVYSLYQKGIKVNAIGYKEFYDYFEGKKTLVEVINEIKKNTRRYAKRQLTYFRNKLPVNWFNLENVSADIIMKQVEDWLHKRG